MRAMKVPGEELCAAFERVRKIGRVTGFELTKDTSRIQKAATAVYLFAVYLYSAIFLSQFNLQQDIPFYLFVVSLALIVPRITLMRVHRTKLASLLTQLETSVGFKVKRSAQLRYELERALSKATSIQFPMAFCTFVVSIMGWLFTNTQNTLPFGPMPMWVMNYGYTACFIFQVTLFLILIIDYIIPDVIKLCIMLQLRIHLKFLRSGIEEVLDNAKEEFCTVNKIEPSLVNKQNVLWAYQKNHLENIISHHVYIANMANETESIFNKCVLFTFLNSSIFICIVLFRISSIPLFNAEFWKLCAYTIIAFAFYFGDCYFTQRVLSEYEGLVQSCYNVDFIGSNLVFQKCLIMIMARAQKSFRFTIGKFAPVTIATIFSILQASYSYFTLLQSRRK